MPTAQWDAVVTCLVTGGAGSTSEEGGKIYMGAGGAAGAAGTGGMVSISSGTGTSMTSGGVVVRLADVSASGVSGSCIIFVWHNKHGWQWLYHCG